jgi:hypothetical protein
MSRPNPARRQQILAVIRSDERVSIREICERVGLASPSTVYFYLNQLEKAGEIHRAGGARGIFLGPAPAGFVTKSRSGKPKQKKAEEGNVKVKGKLPRILENPKGVLRKDPNLEARINAVVAKARQRDAAPNGDVVHGSGWTLLPLDHLKASRIG